MIPHLYLIGLVASSAVLGVCLAALFWSNYLRARLLEAYDLGRVHSYMHDARQSARQVDAGYRSGWAACEREYARRTPAQGAIARRLAYQAALN